VGRSVETRAEQGRVERVLPWDWIFMALLRTPFERPISMLRTLQRRGEFRFAGRATQHRRPSCAARLTSRASAERMRAASALDRDHERGQSPRLTEKLVLELGEARCALLYNRPVAATTKRCHAERAKRPR